MAQWQSRPNQTPKERKQSRIKKLWVSSRAQTTNASVRFAHLCLRQRAGKRGYRAPLASKPIVRIMQEKERLLCPKPFPLVPPCIFPARGKNSCFPASLRFIYPFSPKQSTSPLSTLHLTSSAGARGVNKPTFVHKNMLRTTPAHDRRRRHQHYSFSQILLQAPHPRFSGSSYAPSHLPSRHLPTLHRSFGFIIKHPRTIPSTPAAKPLPLLIAAWSHSPARIIFCTRGWSVC